MENQEQPTNIEPQMPVQPVTEPIQASTPPPIESKKSLPKWPLIVVGVILLATLLTGSFVLYKNLNVKPKPASKTVQVITPTATPTPDPTADWKTEETVGMSFTFKYPSDWQISNQTHQGQLYERTLTNPQDKSSFISIALNAHPIDYQKQLLNDEDAVFSSKSVIENSTFQEKNILKATTTDREWDHENSKYIETGHSYSILIPIENNTLEITTNNLENKPLADKILNTIKFTDQTIQATSSPDEVANSFYQSYLTCINKHFQSQSSKSTKEDCPFSSYGALNANLITKLNVPGFADPVLCAQNTPSSISVEPAVINNDNTATEIVHELFSGSSDNSINVALSNQNGNWVIADIICPKP